MKYRFLIQRLGNIKRCNFLLLLVVAFICNSSIAQGNLLIYPKRIVFEGSKRAQVLNIANTGTDTIRYLISVVQMRMKQDGSFETITQPDSNQFFSDKNFRFFPRNVVLGPGESQTVKMQVINSTRLEPGEYRSHLYFRAEPEKTPLGEAEARKQSTSISVQITAVFGISIPVIIRVGETTMNTTISHASLELNKDSSTLLKITFDRSGNMSAYGDVFIDHINEFGQIFRHELLDNRSLLKRRAVGNRDRQRAARRIGRNCDGDFLDENLPRIGSCKCLNFDRLARFDARSINRDTFERG